MIRAHCGYLILSDDTDALLILLINTSTYRQNFIHVLNDTAHYIDEPIYRIQCIGQSGGILAIAYALTGLDFNPAIHGLGHDNFYAMCSNSKHVGYLECLDEENLDTLDTFICLMYLHKEGIRIQCKADEKREQCVTF